MYRIIIPETENPQEAKSFTQSPQCWFSRGTAQKRNKDLRCAGVLWLYNDLCKSRIQALRFERAAIRMQSSIILASEISLFKALGTIIKTIHRKWKTLCLGNRWHFILRANICSKAMASLVRCLFLFI